MGNKKFSLAGAVRNRMIERRMLKPGDLLDHPMQWRAHNDAQAAAAAGVLLEVGIADSLKAWYSERAGGKLVTWDGHLRKSLDPDLEWPVDILDITDREADYLLATHDPLGAMAGQDAAALADLLHNVGSGEAAVQELLAEIYPFDVDSDGGADDVLQDVMQPPAVTKRDVPDEVFASDNDFGIPLLDIAMQADAIASPVQAWGSGAAARSRQNSGMWHFYTEDYRFDALWADPSPVVNSGCAAVVEANFSAYSNMPRAVALWAIYRKRWLARWWQMQGVRVFVDLNVAENHYEDNLLGVPSGWTAYATRGYESRWELTEREFALACGRAGTEQIQFLVYGGGKVVRDRCKGRGWMHIAEQRDVAKGRWQDG